MPSGALIACRVDTYGPHTGRIWFQKPPRARTSPPFFVHRQELVDLVGYIVGVIVVQVPVPIEGE